MSETLRIMTFNVRGAFTERHPERLWTERADLNVRTIREQNVDVIGFQEVQRDNRDVYARRLPAYRSDVGREDVSAADDWIVYNPVYWRESRLERLDSGGFFLSETPDVWSMGWDAAFVRGATWVRFALRGTDLRFFYLNAHLDHIGETARVEGSRVIVDQLAALAGDLPVVVTADFNSRAWAPDDEDAITYPGAVKREYLPPGGTVHRVFTGAGFRDTFTEAGHYNQLDMNTFHAFLGDEFPPCALRIDWILVRDGAQARWATRSCDIVRDAEPPVFPSDHYPVVAELTLSPVG